MSGPSGRRKRARAPARCRTLVLHHHFDHARATGPCQPHAAAHLECGIDRIVHQVDEQLIELVSVRRDDDGRAFMHPHVEPRLQRRDPVDPFGDPDRADSRAGEPGQPVVGPHEPAQGLRAAFDDLEPGPQILLPVRRPLLSPREAPEAAGDRFDRGERVVDLVTEHPHDPLPRRALLRAQHPAQIRQHQQLVRQPVLP
jgi:hypothetical protein